MSSLRAACARIDLRPIPGAPLTGFAARLGPSTGSHDPLLGRAFLLDDGSTRLLWITLDLLGLSTTADRLLRKRIAGALELPISNVFISCSHTHSGPVSMPLRGPFGAMNESWLDGLMQRITELTATLSDNLRPAKLRSNVIAVPGLGYNRQEANGPVDQRLMVAAFEGEDGRAIGTLLNYALHPVVLGETNTVYSADYVGQFAAAVERNLGGEALFIQGSAGDIDPVNYRDAGRNSGNFRTIAQIGNVLADSAIRALASSPPIAEAKISAVETLVDVPVDPPPSVLEMMATKKELLKNRGDPAVIPTAAQGKWAISELAWIDELQQAMSENKVPSSVRAPMSAIRIGDLYAVTFPFEIYSQIGLTVRQQLQPHHVIIAGYTNGLIGYAPTARAKKQGGYGPACSHRFFPELLTALGMDAEQTLANAAVNLARSLDPLPASSESPTRASDQRR